MIASAVVFLPGTGVSAPVDGGRRSVEQSPIQDGVAARPPAAEMLRGTVEAIDQGTDSITIRLPSKATQQFKVQDALLFNAVRFGDEVQVSVQDIDGFRTIVALSER
ncbi:copper-binding protein [Bradyrhizobium sp. WSM 1704]|uniref:hypothetical protein n=1 Tax=Bradyrhizobium semiaridum TaxID=2821404 RepID=UPI001CE242DC|nr:hypothetical protein [Bradyrhizobium semiaridum]MCA6124522.1 copper-binding protein [Bradyrhizobium semiaridum]